MIKQDFQLTLGAVVCDFGKGDIHVGIDSKQDDVNKVTILFSNGEPAEIGEMVRPGGITPVVMNFDNVKSLEVVKGVIEKAIEDLQKKRATEKSGDCKFSVKSSNVFVPNEFKKTNPSFSKVMSCTENFLKTGEIDREIVVSENLVLKDGYVGLLVARNYGVDKIKVSAPDGIIILVGNKAINFKSDKIALSYGMRDNNGNTEFVLKIQNCGNTYEFLAATPTDAVNLLDKINKVFEAEYTILGASTMCSGLAAAMNAKGIEFKRA